MSIDLEIIPWTRVPVSWSSIKAHLANSATSLSHARLLSLGQGIAIPDERPLSLGGFYVIDTGEPNTLTLSVVENRGNIDEQGYVEDYGRNLSRERLSETIKRWRDSGHYYEITTMAGRSSQEPLLFAQLATALAAATGGLIIVMNDDIFDCDVGIYRPDEFRKLRPLFA